MAGIVVLPHLQLPDDEAVCREENPIQPSHSTSHCIETLKGGLRRVVVVPFSSELGKVAYGGQERRCL